MTLFHQIEAVYQRALLLRQYALESPSHDDLLEKALNDLYFVLEELQTTHEELQHQQHELLAHQQAIELERRRYQMLFESAPNAYLVTDLKGLIYQANRSAALLFGASQDSLINKLLLVFTPEPDRPALQTQLANLTSGLTWETTLTSRQGKLVWVAIAITRIKDTAQRDVLLWSLHDITRRKQIEHQLQVGHAELELQVAQQTAELIKTHSQLQSLQESHLRFLAASQQTAQRHPDVMQ